MSPRRFLPLLIAAVVCAPAICDTFDDLARQANAAREADQIPRAVDLYRQALNLKLDWPEGWWFLGTLFYDSDRYEEGRDAFTHFTKLQDSAPGWGLLGLCEFQVERYADALAHIDRALSEGAGKEAQLEQVLEFHKAAALTKQGLYDRAIHEYLYFPPHKIKGPDLLAALGAAVLRRPLAPKEIPQSQAPLFSAAGTAAYAWMSGDIPGAKSAFAELLSQFPAERGVHYFYGTFLLDFQPVEAGAELQKELEIDPGNAWAKGMIALTRYRAGESASALPIAREAAQQNPSAAIARFVYGLSLEDAGDAAAVDNLKAALDLDPSNLEYHLALAGAYSRFGLDAEAYRERAASIALAKATDPNAPR